VRGARRRAHGGRAPQTDVRYGERFCQIRKIFGDSFPGSATVTITPVANPDAKIEIQGYPVMGSK
jgi:hypothetical protein